MPQHTVLIVDDEKFVRDSLVDLVDSEGFRTLSADGVGPALKLVEDDSVDVIVTDLQMLDGDGMGLLQAVVARRESIPVILLTGVGTVKDAVSAMKAGAFDFIQKPVEPEQFVLLLRRALEHRDLVSEVDYLRRSVADLRGPREMVGSAPKLEEARSLLTQVATSDATVLITGESGTGKELAALEVHEGSARSGRKMVRVNCAAVSQTLFESEFFGHRKGAFTGAIEDRKGRIAEAEGGTLVLDEIGTLQPEMQAKLLRVLETGEYQVVGESRTRQADIRIVAMTNEDLEERVKDGSFRSDLFYRLNVFPVVMPPLRERRDDIPLLARHFLGRELSDDALRELETYSWPGNVRELKNVLERAAILAGSAVPDADLFRRILGDGPGAAGDDEGDLHLKRRGEALERRLILEALERTGGKKKEAAELLGIDPRNFGYYSKKHDLKGGDEGER